MLFDLIFRKKDGTQKRVYLDYAAATPVHPDVLKVMQPYFSHIYGNPGAIHSEGRKARAAIEEVRSDLARVLHIRPEGVVFTGNGTEANNLALRGIVAMLHEAGRKESEIEIITTAIEHPSILKVVEYLQTQGVKVQMCRISEEGRIDVSHLKELFNKKTALVSCTYVNSEIGTVEDVKRISRLVRDYNTKYGTEILVHLDAAQAPLWLSIEMDMLGIDLMSLDAGKCYGPKGVGVLAFRHGVHLKGVMFGGEQEMGLRAGTENTPLIVGCVYALVRAQKEWRSRSEAVASLRDRLIRLLEKEIPGCVLNGSRENRVANNVNISIPGIDSEYAVVTLDVQGIAASTKSACGSVKGSGSYVVREVTQDESRATSTIRFTLGEATTDADILLTIGTLKKHVAKMRAFSDTQNSI